MKSRRRKKQLIILIGVILSLVLGILIVVNLFVTSLSINLNGQEKETIEVGSDYKEEGAKAYLGNLFSKKEMKVEVTGNVDTTKLGKYIVVYEVENNGYKKQKERVITVVDKEAPTINLNSEIKTCKSQKNVTIDATVNDNYDGDITDKLSYKIEDDFIILTTTDTSNNKAELKEKLTYIDDEKPIIKLNGSTTTYVKVGTIYEEAGATATDSCDGDISKNIKTESNVDANTLGNYEVTYMVTDSAGATDKVTRKVIVTDQDSLVNGTVTNGVIYLTFDDGPGAYTTTILDILDKYNVKATFFVTNQFQSTKYLSLIKEEANRGHVVGVHTYSHKWNIYDSVDAYLNDFNKMEQIVYEQTGVHPKYFRFPGGTSNTVSRSHCQGIMTTLSKLMTEKGYTYFDWNVDSGDSHGKKATASYVLNNIKTYVKGNGSYIILMHDIQKSTKEALENVIIYLKDKGYVFKSIDESTPLKQFTVAN